MVAALFVSSASRTASAASAVTVIVTASPNGRITGSVISTVVVAFGVRPAIETTVVSLLIANFRSKAPAVASPTLATVAVMLFGSWAKISPAFGVMPVTTRSGNAPGYLTDSVASVVLYDPPFGTYVRLLSLPAVRLSLTSQMFTPRYPGASAPVQPTPLNVYRASFVESMMFLRVASVQPAASPSVAKVDVTPVASFACQSCPSFTQ